MRGAFHVDALIGLGGGLAVDAGAVGDGVAAVEGASERRRVGEVGRNEGGMHQAADGGVAAVVAAGDEDGFVPGGNERASGMAADETGGAGDGDFHVRLLCLRLLRW